MKFIPFILLEVLVSTCILKLIDIYLLNNVFMKDFFPVVLVAVTGLVSRILFFVVKKIDVDNISRNLQSIITQTTSGVSLFFGSLIAMFI